VVADLTIENPNVWYELGVRHALRARGVVLVCGGKVTTAFDIYTDRKLRYALKDGVPADLVFGPWMWLATMPSQGKRRTVGYRGCGERSCQPV
jgi:hypothetical protein